MAWRPTCAAPSTRRHQRKIFDAIKAAAVPGDGVAYSVGVRALQALDKDGAFPPPSPHVSILSTEGKAAPHPRASPPRTAPAGHSRPAVTEPDTWRPAGVRPAGHISVGGLRLPGHTRLLRAGAFSGSVPHGVCSGTSVRWRSRLRSGDGGMPDGQYAPWLRRTLHAHFCGQLGVDHHGTEDLETSSTHPRSSALWVMHPSCPLPAAEFAAGRGRHPHAHSLDA